MKRMWSKNELKKNVEEVASSGNLPSVKADEIIENMSGYSIAKLTEIAWTPMYVGACKNGNKLTLVVFGKFTYNNQGVQTPTLLSFVLPKAIYDKLIPYTLSGDNRVLQTYIQDLWTGLSTTTPIKANYMKSTTEGYINLNFVSISGLTNGAEYFFRSEVTFLLSDNLAA